MTFYKIKLALLPSLINNNSVGFMISGGFDSGLMLYLCCLIKQQENLSTTFVVFTVPRHDDSISHANRIVDWINKKFDNSLEIFTVGDPNLHHSQQVYSGVKDAYGCCEYIVLSDTTNPAHLLNGPFRSRSNQLDVIHPFFNLTKKDTVALAIELELTDLMILSHTCTESVLLRCGKCWQCQERAWGFSENNYIDPGTM